MNTPNFEWGKSRDYSNQYLNSVKLNRDKIYRIVLYSKDGLNGSANHTDNVFFVNLPDTIQEPNKYHMAIESFVVDCQTTSNKPIAFAVEFLDVNQPDTYNTSTANNSRIAASCVMEGTGTWNGTTAGFRNWVNYQKNITSDTIGIPLIDTNIMRSKQLRIQLKNAADAALATNVLGTNTNWIMTIIVYPFSP